MRSRPQFGVKQAGVTLMELLVAITLLGLVSLGLLFAMRVGVSAWQRASARMSADRSTVAAANLLTAQLGGARAKYVEWSDRDRRASFLYFEGRSDRLRFLTDYSVATRARGGVYLAEYWFEHNAANECRLLYNESPVHSDADALSTVAEVVQAPAETVITFRAAGRTTSTRILYSGLSGCSFEYLIEPYDKPVFWSANWPGDPRLLPHAVAVRFQSHESRGIAPVATVAIVNAREVWP